MAGKSNRAKKKAAQSTAIVSEQPAPSKQPVPSQPQGNDSAATASEQPVPTEPQVNDIGVSDPNADANGTVTELAAVESEQKDAGDSSSDSQAKQGDVHLYPVTVKTQSGDKMELQLSPGDSVMDVRQFLLDAPETCYFTCYDLSLHTKDGSVHHLEDFNEISEVADITPGGCYLEMVAAQYDDRSIRAHVNRTRELLSLSTLHSSLSTSLALQHENAKSSPANSGDASKAEVPELDNMVFMENAPGSLSNLFSPPSKEIKCIESVVFSSFNPPPSYRRLSGDLIYLDVVTLEGNTYCITGTTRTFYVNSSTGNHLDPRPSRSGFEATTLVGLLQKISSKFKKAFREILDQKASAHPFENVPSMLPPTSWIGLHPIPGKWQVASGKYKSIWSFDVPSPEVDNIHGFSHDSLQFSNHRRDAARAEDALTLTFGSELIGMQRDWNEELQSCREFPHTSLQERILRDRALYKVTSDFVDAAIKGAAGVISRCIPPINPTDPECFHMYVHNNIFFSFAVDAELEQLSKKQSSDVNGKVESTVALPAQPDKSSSNSRNGVPKQSNNSNEGKINGVIDPMEDAPAENQLAESEQATYASANNDLKGTKAYQEADIPGLYNLAMAIIDYRGHRVVAQSVLPGILQGDKSDSLLYGSVDNGKKICWNEDFHSKVAAAAKCLHLKEHEVSDGSGVVFKLAAPVECKGIVGSDDRHYLLDLMRVTPRDANYTGPGSRFCILRPELITAYCHSEAAKRSKTPSKSELETDSTSDPSLGEDAELVKKTTNELESASSDVQDVKGENAVAESASENESKDSHEEIVFNPNVFTEFKLAGSPEEIAADEENVRKASLYLNDVVIPKFIQDLCALEVSPMDGHTFTEALHAHGINIRYIGKVAEGTRQLPHLWDLVSNEIVVRSAKHVLKEVLRDTEDHDVGEAISHVFNCLFGSVPNASSGQKKDTTHQSSGKSSKGRVKHRSTQSTKKKQTLFANINSDSLWGEIQEFAKIKYQFEFPEDARTRVKKIPVIRNLCQKVGVTIAARKYDLNAETPFQISDIMDLKPVVKHSIPVSSDAKNLVETGKVQLAEGMLAEAYTLFSEAFAIFQQVTGPMHREVANCCRYLAMVLYHAGDMPAAIMQQHKELIINERCLGLDHPDTAHSYGNMALFYHGLNQTELALRHMSRALLLLSLSCGPDHPDVAATFINVAMMYQDIGKMNTALRYLQEALKKNERLLGEEHIQTAVCYHALAIAFNCIGAFKLSHQHEKKTYDILVKQLGEDDSRTRDSQNWMKTFKMRELQMNAQKQKGQALNAASAQKAIEIIKANPDLMQAFQSATGAGGSGGPSAAIKSLNAAFMGEAQALPRGGRGVDERGARAAADMRKKAAAKGLLIRPHGQSVSAQAIPPMTQLLNIINSGATPEPVIEKNGEKEANGHSSNGPENATEGQVNTGKQPNQAPVGLGSGLALDPKKPKAKAKPSS